MRYWDQRRRRGERGFDSDGGDDGREGFGGEGLRFGVLARMVDDAGDAGANVCDEICNYIRIFFCIAELLEAWLSAGFGGQRLRWFDGGFGDGSRCQGGGKACGVRVVLIE